MKPLILTLSAFLAVPVHAAQTLEFRLSKDGQTFVHKQTVTEDDQATFAGDMVSKNGTARRAVVINQVLSRTDNGAYSLSFQFEVSSAPGSLTVHSEIGLAPGASLTVAQCGGWTLAVAMLGGKAAAPAGNYRLTAESGGAKCSVVAQSGAQTNVVADTTAGGRGKGTIILNAIIGEDLVVGDELRLRPFGASVQFQSPSGALIENDASLSLGRKQRVNNKDAAGGLTLLLEAAR